MIEEAGKLDEERKASGKKCARCDEPVTLEDYRLGGGLCDYCAHMMNKDD
jgi:formylmethanofuran dehydrogenase subunit E